MTDREETRETSKWAWLSTREHQPTVRNTILQLLKEREMTDDEIEEATEMRHQSVSATRRGLVRDGIIEATGKKRPTRSGRLAVVWRIADERELVSEEVKCPF